MFINLPWYMYAIGAALVWGVHYNLLSKAMTTISPITAYWLPTTIMLLGMPLFYKTLWSDFQATLKADLAVQVSVSVIAFTSFLATVLLYKAIQSHNPVHASLIEITFPLFVAICSILLFKENHLDVPTVIGGLLILSGAGVIIYFGGEAPPPPPV